MAEEEKKKENTESQESSENKESLEKDESSEKDSSKENNSEKSEEKKEKSTEEIEKEKRQNRQLRNLLIVLGLVLVLTFGIFYVGSQPEKVQYKNLEFESYTDSGGITFYRTGIPRVTQAGEVAGEELFYLRTHPNKLKNVSFNGSIEFEDKLLISSENPFVCDGHGVISTGNVNNLYKFIGLETNTTQNKTTCNPNDDTMNLKLVEGNKTELRQTGPACYEAVVHECEVLKPTEKFMAETISLVNSNIEYNLNQSS